MQLLRTQSRLPVTATLHPIRSPDLLTLSFSMLRNLNSSVFSRSVELFVSVHPSAVAVSVSTEGNWSLHLKAVPQAGLWSKGRGTSLSISNAADFLGGSRARGCHTPDHWCKESLEEGASSLGPAGVSHFYPVVVLGPRKPPCKGCRRGVTIPGGHGIQVTQPHQECS